jgi:integrase/recombinase XerD
MSLCLSAIWREHFLSDLEAMRGTGITTYLERGGTLGNARAMAAHESPRTTKLYDRTGDQITHDEVEKIHI